MDLSLGLGAAQMGLGAVSGIFGGIKAGKARKKMNRFLDRQNTDNEAWYNANYHANYLERADSQNLMKNLRENLAKDNKAAANMAVVTGATPEQMAVQKEQSNRVISDTYSNLGAMGQQWKDNIMSTYLNRKSDIANQRMGVMGQEAQSYENLMMSGVNAVMGSGGNAGSNLLSGK